MKEPPKPPPDPPEELLREWSELGAFGVEWVKKWLDLRERLGWLRRRARLPKHQKRRKQDEGMKVWKIKQYLPALLLHVQRRVGGERGVVVAVRTRDTCGVDRRCGMAVHSLMMRLVEKGLAKDTRKEST